MVQELAYSIHLGSDKNRSKVAKKVAKGNGSSTTSFSNNAIQNAQQLSKVNKHNLRDYDHKTDDIQVVYGTNDLYKDVQNLYQKEFLQAQLEYDNKQTRADRKIGDYFNHISKDSKHDLACELIIELGDMDFWNDKTMDYKKQMTEVYKDQIYKLMEVVPDFKVANAVVHYDETSPHMHLVGIPVKEGYKNGMKKQVAKSKIFTKESLKILQDKMRAYCIEKFNEVYVQKATLKKKQKGKIELDVFPKYFFLNISKEIVNTEILDKDKYNNFISTDIELNKIYECLNVNVDEIIYQIQADYPDRVVNKDSIKTFIEDEKLRRFNELIDNKFNENQLVQLFTYIENNDRSAINEYVDWNSDVPTIFEYILGITWYRFSNRRGNILEYMKLSLDANLLPKTHAAGGTADIVYEYNKTNDYPEHKVLLEATLTESTSQRKSEMEPVSRHLMREIQENDNDDTYAVFVANILQEEVLSDFRSRKNYQFRGKNSVKSGLKIISLSIRDIIKLINIKIQYSKLYKIFDEAYKNTNINDLEWYEKLVKNKINNL